MARFSFARRTARSTRAQSGKRAREAAAVLPQGTPELAPGFDLAQDWSEPDFERDWSEPDFERDWPHSKDAPPLPATLGSTAAGIGLQAAFKVSQPGDPLEREADRVADHVTRMPASGTAPSLPGPRAIPTIRAALDWSPGGVSAEVQRACATCSGEEDEGRMQMQRAARGAARAARTQRGQFADELRSARRGGGEPLLPGVSEWMEARLGQEFGAVRVHRASAAHALTQEVQARAFTIGNDVFFGRGEYQPGTERGRHLIAHELTHVVQQTGGATSAVQRQASEPLEELEPFAGEETLDMRELEIEAEEGIDEEGQEIPDEGGTGIETEESSTDEESAPAASEEDLETIGQRAVREESPDEGELLQAKALHPGALSQKLQRLENEADLAASGALSNSAPAISAGAAVGALQRAPVRGKVRKPVKKVTRKNRLKAKICGRPSARIADWPKTFISRIDVNLTSPDHAVTLTWAGPNAAAQPKGPFHGSPGAGRCKLDCNDHATSNTPDSLCTPKGEATVHGHNCAMSSYPEAKNVTWFGRAGIALHFYPSVPNHPASHGCVRLGVEASRIIYDNSVRGTTKVFVGGTWKRGSKCY